MGSATVVRPIKISVFLTPSENAALEHELAGTGTKKTHFVAQLIRRELKRRQNPLKGAA